MAVIEIVRLSPLSGIVITVTQVSTELDVTIAKWGERNVICVCRSDIRLVI